jgi:hypothetical protein
VSEPLHPEELMQLRGLLESLLNAIAHEEITASTGTRYRLEGAVTVLGVALGEDADGLVDRLTHDS